MASCDPRRTVTWLGTTGAGLLLATLAGTAVASYAVSGVDPFYFSGVGLRTPQATPDRRLEADIVPQTTSSFPGMPGDQYYYYRPPAVTASYDAVPIKPAPAVDIIETARPSDRDATDEDISVPPVAEDRTTQPNPNPVMPSDEQTTEANAATE